MKAAIYMRVSTEEQRERQSIATQRDFAERYCALHEIPIAGFYADDGVTGTMSLEQRPEGHRLLGDAKAKKFDAVLIYKLDRLGREPRLILNAVKELEDLGVEVRSMTEPFDTSTPAGRFLLTILSGVAGLERENILQRSAEGINRLVREGAWVGGIVPYGYRVKGERRGARLVVSEAPVPGTGLTEADVIRLIFRMAGEEGKSCIAIADHLNRLGVPAAYARESSGTLLGKRRRTTSGIWRNCRIQYVLKNATYKGVHIYGKNPKNPKRPPTLIERPVPAIVDSPLWERATQTLRRNLLFSRRNARRRYLLRGLIKCGHCGRTYFGTGYSSGRRAGKTFYVCNGRHQGRKAFPDPELRCRSKQVSGDIEHLVWRDLEGFLRNPGAVLRQLAARLRTVVERSSTGQVQLVTLRSTLAGKDEERNRIISLFRRGRIDDGALDRQLDEIEKERAGLQEEIGQFEAAGDRARETQVQLETAGELLSELNRRLDQPLTWELKRQLVETLVEGVRVETVADGSYRDSRVTVTYRFSVPDGPIATHTPARTTSSRRTACRTRPPRARARDRSRPLRSDHPTRGSVRGPSSPRSALPRGEPSRGSTPRGGDAVPRRCRPWEPARAPWARPRRTARAPARHGPARDGCRRGTRW